MANSRGAFSCRACIAKNSSVSGLTGYDQHLPIAKPGWSTKFNIGILLMVSFDFNDRSGLT